MEKYNQDWNYSISKFLKLFDKLFCSTEKARTKLVECEELFLVISAEGFANPENRERWKFCEDSIINHIKNYGTEKYPDYRLTIQNKRIEEVLENILTIYLDLSSFDWV